VVRWFVSWLPHRVTIILRAALRWEHALIAKVARRLASFPATAGDRPPRSVISTMMIAVLGFFLTYQIADGLLANAENAAHSQASTGLSTAARLSDLTCAKEQLGREDFMFTAAQTLQQQTGAGDNNYYVMVGLRSDTSWGLPTWSARPSSTAARRCRPS